MGKKLVIVESPAKAKTINKILGSDYIVKSSVGHVRDLPEKKLGVDIENDFKPSYVLSKGKKKVVDELRKAVRDCDAIYLAPDPDREGEAIAWHLKALLEGQAKDKPFLRVQYNEITPRAVNAAFLEPGEIDMHRVDAQQARRILDRIVGYTVSPMLWRRLRRGLSAGRVQSVALRLVCEREQEIRSFVPETYWIFGANVRKMIAPLDPFDVKLTRIDGEKAEIKTPEFAKEIREDLESRALRVASVKTRDVTRRAPPPFITSSLQQAASNRHQFSPRRTMGIAQSLYEGLDFGQGAVGLITYMRTDSVSVSRDAIEACRAHITDQIGGSYLPEKPNVFKSRGSAQEAHEAIRPTDVTRTPRSLKGRLESAEWKLYELIWKRFVSSQMANAIIEQRSVEIDATRKPDAPVDAAGHDYLFRASTSAVKFAGYMKVSGTDIGKKDENGDELDKLPELKEGEALECLEWLSDEKQTTPPARFSEASLVRELERNGVGRPSTYAQTIGTLSQRKYVERQKRSLAATDLGMQVSALLTETLNDLFNVTFTAEMESELDAVEEGKVEWTQMLKAFHEKFAKWMEGTKAPPADAEMLAKVLTALETVTEWAPEVKRGKRKYSDKTFVESIRNDVDNSERDISQRQFEALIKIACIYHRQSPAIKDMIKEAGFEQLLHTPEFQPPLETTRRKLELLDAVEMDEGARKFVDSLKGRVIGNRRLTPAQLGALNNVVVSHSALIPDFESIKDALDLGEVAEQKDEESGDLLVAMAHVSEWRPATTRGKRTYDDKSFFESLRNHYQTKKFLSIRQRKALRAMVERYGSTIPGYADLADRLGLRIKQEKEES